MKGIALKRGIAATPSSAEVLIILDSDTVLHREAISWLLLFAFTLAVLFEMTITANHRKKTMLEQRYPILLMVTFPLQRLLLEVILWRSNISGLIDELLNRKKTG